MKDRTRNTTGRTDIRQQGFRQGATALLVKAKFRLKPEAGAWRKYSQQIDSNHICLNIRYALQPNDTPVQRFTNGSNIINYGSNANSPKDSKTYTINTKENSVSDLKKVADAVSLNQNKHLGAVFNKLLTNPDDLSRKKRRFERPEHITDDDVLHYGLCTKAKYEIFKQIVSEISQTQIENAAKLLINQIGNIINTKRGFHLISKILDRSIVFMNYLMNLDKAGIMRFLERIVGSKTLQYLLTIRDEYILISMDNLRKHFDSMSSTVPGIYFICECVRQARKKEIDIDWLFDFLLSDCAKVLTSKYRKRILLTYLETGERKYQDRVYNEVLSLLKIDSIFSDKYDTLILAELVKHHHQLATNDVMTILKRDSVKLFKNSYFKLMLKQMDLQKIPILYNWIHDELMHYKARHGELDSAGKAIIMDVISIYLYSLRKKNKKDLDRLCVTLSKTTGVPITQLYTVAEKMSAKDSSLSSKSELMALLEL